MIKSEVSHLALKASLLLAILSIASSCIHDSWDNCPIYPQVNLNVDVKFNISDLQNQTTEPGTKSATTDQCLRFIFEIYQYDNITRPVERREITVDEINPHKATLNEWFTLTAQKYFVIVWADYLNKSNKADQFYGTQSLYSITFKEPFVSGTDNRDCFIGGADIDLTAYEDNPRTHVSLTVPIYRPVAKYTLIANDIDKYLDKLNPTRITRAETDINKYTAVITYPGYMPNSINVRTTQPNDSRTGLQYASKCQVMGSSKALIGFDYPLVNGTSSQAKVNLKLYDEAGKLVNEIDDITFPIKRDSLTVVTSNFFTRAYSPGININPGYDGSIDIVLPD